MGYRVAFRAALKTALDTYAAANVTGLRGVMASRPASLDELPCAWVDRIDTSFDFFNGIRQQHLTATVTLADVPSDPVEAEARLDTLADGLLETFSAPHLVDGYSITTALGYNVTLVSEGTPYLGVDFLIRLDLGQGRP